MRQRWWRLLDWWRDDARAARRRLGFVAVAQPSPWQSVVWHLPDGPTREGDVGLTCWWNAFQQGDVVYRWPCLDRDGVAGQHVVAFDLRAP